MTSSLGVDGVEIYFICLKVSFRYCEEMGCSMVDGQVHSPAGGRRGIPCWCIFTFAQLKVTVFSEFAFGIMLVCWVKMCEIVEHC